MGTGISDFDSYLFAIGQHFELYRKLGAHPCERDGVAGTRFAVWAPHARSVSVVGDFNGWVGRDHHMERGQGAGVLELFVPGVGPGALYKYEVVGADGRRVMKSDPVGFAMELRPASASVVTELEGYEWKDQAWCGARAPEPWAEPFNVYEVHPGSWKRIGDGDQQRMLTWHELAAELIPYVQELGYTHIELMGVAEHPLDASWGYQVVGYFAPTSRHGSPQDFMYFVDRCHQAGIGVILDWVPSHFPRDAHGLARFDGTTLYEYSDPRVGEHQEWGTKVFDYGHPQVRNFLIANALFWLDVYHIDGLRVDAVASMLYLDYSRDEGQWIANRYGGRENLEAISFLKELNDTVNRYRPGTVMIAEESTAFPAVTKWPDRGGLGFRFKWNMGWMNDTLRYMALDPVHRRGNSELVTFSMMYAWSENYMLALSHDEFVHGKGSLVQRMSGNEYWRLAQVRMYLGYQMGHPGKQLLFMGCEFGQQREWSEARSLDWHLLEDSCHAALHDYVRDLNALYRVEAACWRLDADPSGFEWLKVDDHAQSVYAFARYAHTPARDEAEAAAGGVLVFVFNFTPVAREQYRFRAPLAGRYTVLLDTDDPVYGGTNRFGAQRAGDVFTSAESVGETVASTEKGEAAGSVPGTTELCLDLPPLAMLLLRFDGPA
jgi:1,4-alpha-glucan branching enzyme